MRLIELHHNPILAEGGNVFKSPDGTIQTKRIELKDIKPTLQHLEKITKLPLVNNTLGSVGKKESSGDIDVAVDPLFMTKDQLVQNLKKYVESINGGDPSQWVKKSGISVHFKMPIRNDPSLGFVQVDFMFHGGGPAEEQWLKFGMFSAGDSSEYTGADRNLLMSSVAKALGMKYSWQKGLIRREDETPISKDPNVIAKKMFGPRYNQDVFLSVETLQDAIHKTPQLVKDFQKLVKDLAQDVNPDGTPRKPGDIRKNQEEVARITRLTGIK
jgi:hypothetical protein